MDKLCKICPVAAECSERPKDEVGCQKYALLRMLEALILTGKMPTTNLSNFVPNNDAFVQIKDCHFCKQHNIIIEDLLQFMNALSEESLAKNIRGVLKQKIKLVKEGLHELHAKSKKTN